MIKNLVTEDNKIDPKRKDLILRFSYFRVKNKLSALALSLMLGNSKAYIGKFEQGKLNMSMDKLLECISIFGVSNEEFFSDNYQNYAEEKKIINKFRKLSKESQELVLNLMDSLK